MVSMRVLLALGLAILSSPLPAVACPMFRPRNPADVMRAEVVVMGRLTDYEVMPLRRTRDALGRPTGWSGGHAEFDLAVERSLVGATPRRIRVRWSNSTFGTPGKMPDGVYLVALHPPGRAGDRDYRVYQQPCSGAFLLKAGSLGSVQALRVLAGLPPHVPDPQPPEPAPPPPGAGPAPAAAATSLPARTAPWPEKKQIPALYWITFGFLAVVFAQAYSAFVWRRTSHPEDATPDKDVPSAD